MTSASRIVVTGSNGQLGRRLVDRLVSTTNSDVVGLDLPELNITDSIATRSLLHETKPEWVVNCAAMTHVDGCETEAEKATAVNAGAVATLASACNEIGAALLQISTDFVFSGKSCKPYTEEDEVGPQGVYAVTKWKGEQHARNCKENLIVRTAWLYGARQGNFVTAILDRARSGQPLRVVTDEVGSPTFAQDLAEGICELISVGARGTYHFANCGQVSRSDFAKRIVELAGIDSEVLPVTSLEYGAPAPRPAFSVLDCSKYQSATKRAVRDWQSALAAFMAEV